MSTLVDTLLDRASHAANTLAAPAPDQHQIKRIVGSALTAPDHGKLRPWRFVVISEEARHQLGNALAIAAAQADPSLSSDKQDMIKAKALRAPMIIACLVEITEELEKVPPFEQILSAGAAIQQMQLAANDLGFGCCWLSGPYSNTAPVKEFLNAAEKELIAGFVYIGTPSQPAPKKPRPALADHLVFMND